MSARTTRLDRRHADLRVVDLAAYRLEVHPDGCRCCAPAEPSPAQDTTCVAIWCARGVAVGLLLAFLLDRLTGGPGLGVMLGW